MNSYIKAITAFDQEAVAAALARDPKWLSWAEPSGKNALHYLCGTEAADGGKQASALKILKLLLKRGMDINSVHRIDDKNCIFPATPLWYAYTRGRNEILYRHLLRTGANPANCWWAIAWYDDVAAAKLWLKYGAVIDEKPTLDELFIGSVTWKKWEFAGWLLGMGASVDAADPAGITPLMVSVKRKDEAAIKKLIAAGADPDQQNLKGESARDIAIAKGPKRLLDLLKR